MCVEREINFIAAPLVHTPLAWEYFADFLVECRRAFVKLGSRSAVTNAPTMKISLFLAGLVACSVSVKTEIGDPVPLWPSGAPGALGKEEKDVPNITPYSPEPDKATGAALVICPGGGYGGLAPHEGRDYALWLNGHGVTAFVLKYRLGSGGYRHPAMLNDAARALRMVRARAADWKIDSHRVG